MASTKKVWDFVLVGTGPGSAGWLRQIMKKTNGGAKILILEKGPYCKTDILTEMNPFEALRASKVMVEEYEHEVMQGSCLGGGTGVNNYAWVTPALQDIRNSFGGKHFEELIGYDLTEYESLVETIAYKSPLHPLHDLMTRNATSRASLDVRAHFKSKVSESNRGAVHLGCPSIDGKGVRRSAFTSVIEPLLREYHDSITLKTDCEVRGVLWDKNEGEESGRQTNRVVGVQDTTGTRYDAGAVVLGAGCLETPAILMRSGVGPADHLRSRGIDVVVDNEEVGKNLGDKMLTDDMVITDSRLGDFDKSLFLMNIVYPDGVGVQLHRYDKLTFGNTYLAMSRLLRGNGVFNPTTWRNIMKYCSPNNTFCLQTMYKMDRTATVRLDANNRASLDASALFREAQEKKDYYANRINEIYDSVDGIKDSSLGYTFCVPDIRQNPARHMRLVWHFAGSCSAGKVVDVDNFSVFGTRGLHVVDNSVNRRPPDGGGQPMAYLTGHLAAEAMSRGSWVASKDTTTGTKAPRTPQVAASGV